MPSFDDVARCAGALLLVLGTASVFGAVLMTRARDDDPRQLALTPFVLVPILGIVIVALVLEAAT